MLPQWLKTKRRKARDRAEQQIAEIEIKYADVIAMSNPGHKFDPFLEELGAAESVLFWLETGPLIKKAEQCGIEIPSEWWITRKDEPWIKRPYLDKKYWPRLKRMIREERYKMARKYTDLIVPILSLLIALTALLKD